MGLLIAGLLIFLGAHSLAIVAPDLRARARARIGEGPWKGALGLISLAGLIMIVYGFGTARQAPPLYVPPFWLRHVAWLLMLPVFPLMLASGLPGRIKTAAKHPLLAAVKFWALAHLLVNGRLADLLLFGGFLVWAVVDRISLKRRPPQVLRTAPPGKFNDLIAVVGGLALYVFFVLWAHVHLFGVSPLG